MRAVKGSLGHSSKESDENWKVLARGHDTFWCASRWVRKLRAVKD
jgi:hypothetical protein